MYIYGYAIINSYMKEFNASTEKTTSLNIKTSLKILH